MKYTYVMNHIENCVENPVEISKHVKNHRDMTIMWPFSSILKHINSN